MTTRTVAATCRRTTCRVHSRKIRAPIDLAALSEVFAGLESASILGGNVAKADAGGFSYWAAEPREIFEFRSGQKEPFTRLHRVLGTYRLRAAAGVDAGVG